MKTKTFSNGRIEWSAKLTFWLLAEKIYFQLTFIQCHNQHDKSFSNLTNLLTAVSFWCLSDSYELSFLFVFSIVIFLYNRW